MVLNERRPRRKVGTVLHNLSVVHNVPGIIDSFNFYHSHFKYKCKLSEPLKERYEDLHVESLSADFVT